MGQCQLNTLTCATNYVSGCPGASNIQCCQAQCNCVNNMCTNPSQTGQYYLTSFCDSSVSCGDPPASCNAYYAADYMRFGCGAIITVRCANGQSANLKVIDGGPSCSVENSAGGPTIDASYSMCNLCTGSTSCGWSDHIKVTVTWSYLNAYDKTINKEWLETQLGPCAFDPEEARLKGLAVCLGDKLLPDLEYLRNTTKFD